MKKIILIFFVLSVAVSCSQRKNVDVRSPCVSTEVGPCGQKKSVNDWWLKNNV